MRSDIIDAIKRFELGNFRVADELPRIESGGVLFIKNPRRIYVDNVQQTDTPLITALNGLSIWSNAQVITVYFATDSKLLATNYDSLVNQLLELKNILPNAGFNAREAVVSSSYDNDLLITQVEFTFTKLK